MPDSVNALKRSSPLPHEPYITESAISSNSPNTSTVFPIVSITFSAGPTISDIFSVRLLKPFPRALSSNVFLASDILLIKSLRTSDTLVHKLLASSKSPIIRRQVWVHPEPNASLRVSINWVNVLTFVAASPAVLAISAICLASSWVYPCSTNFCTAASYSFWLSAAVENWSRVSVRTSVVSHPVFNDSLNDPSAEIAALAPVCKCSDVLIRASWNTWPPIPALTTEFQSISLTVPDDIAWESWYIAVDACWEDEPDTAAKLAIPLIADTDVSNLTPAAVKVPILRVISVKL